MKRLLAMAIGLALSSTAALADTPYTIAFSLKTVTNDDFQKAIATSIQQAVEKSGNKFLLVTAGDETGVSIQVNQLEDLIAKKVDAIVLNPMDGKAVVPVLKKAQAAKIPVIVVDSSVEKGNEAPLHLLRGHRQLQRRQGGRSAHGQGAGRPRQRADRARR